MKTYISILPIIALFSITGLFPVSPGTNPITTPNYVEAYVPVNDALTCTDSSAQTLATMFSKTQIETVQSSSIILSNHQGGYCSYYSWSCDNPYGDCGTFGGPGERPCTIVCSNGFWVYCDGLDEDPVPGEEGP